MKDTKNKQEIVVTEAMIQKGISVLDDWICLNLREMCAEGHTGHDKGHLVGKILQILG